jgi:GABA(A) receptor-associated protein
MNILKYYNQHLYNSKENIERRLQRSKAVIQKHPTHVPVYITSSRKMKNKYLVERTVPVAQLYKDLVARLNSPDESFTLFTDTNTLLSFSSSMGEVYDVYKNEDGFLYLKLIAEHTFG